MLPGGGGGGLETGHGTDSSGGGVAEVTLLEGLGDLDAVDLDARVGRLLLLLLLFDDEELVRR